MTESKGGAGGLVLTAIVIGAVWVGFGMFRQNGMDGPSVPDMPVLPNYKSQYTGKKSVVGQVKENPYAAALMAPRQTDAGAAECQHFSRLLQDYLAGNGVRSAVPSREVFTTSSVRLDELAQAIDVCFQKNEIELGREKIKEGLTYSAMAKNPVRPLSQVDFDWSAARIEYRARNFDASRQFVEEAIKIAGRHGNYRMEELEGMRSLLVGQGAEAAAFESTCGLYNQSMEKRDYKKLPELADQLQKQSADFPQNSYYRLQADLHKAAALVMAGGDAGRARACIEKAQAQWHRANDPVIANQCSDLLTLLNKN